MEGIIPSSLETGGDDIPRVPPVATPLGRYAVQKMDGHVGTKVPTSAQATDPYKMAKY